MVRLVVILLLTHTAIQAQKHVYTTLDINPTEVYYGQPTEVIVGVYTSTWFTKGVNPGNLNVNGAFTMSTGNQSVTIRDGSNTYAGVLLTFLVIPYQTENIEFPSLSIAVATPDPGASNARQQTLKTAPQLIKLKPIPVGFDQASWLVANSVYIDDQWLGDLQQLKVGDVLSRRVYQSVEGTFAQLIPEMTWQVPQGVSLYPRRPQIRTDRGRTNLTASRTETIRYLFEVEGPVVIPEMVFTWWNPKYKKLYKRTLKSTRLEIAPNPDAALLESRRDSLTQTMVDEGDVSVAFWQTALFRYGIGLLTLVILVYFLWPVLTHLTSKYHQRRAAYRTSEDFFFKEFRRHAKMASPETFRALYRWLDALTLAEPTAQYFADTFGNKALQAFVTTMLSGRVWDKEDFRIGLWQKARKEYFQQKKSKKEQIHADKLNP
jgi:hypothetical protein